MPILILPSNEEQVLTFRPRENAPVVNLRIRNEITGEITTFEEITTSFEGGYLAVPITLNSPENITYEVTATDSEGVILWRGKLFVTSQVSQDYKIND